MQPWQKCFLQHISLLSYTVAHLNQLPYVYSHQFLWLYSSSLFACLFILYMRSMTAIQPLLVASSSQRADQRKQKARSYKVYEMIMTELSITELIKKLWLHVCMYVPWKFVVLHCFLTILPPSISIIKYINLTPCLKSISGLSYFFLISFFHP